MCSVVGYVGDDVCRQDILQGLQRLEYRGYDSAGFACISQVNGRITYYKAAGQLQRLLDKLDMHPCDGPIGIGHTRWATHGHATEQNAHPHFDCDEAVAIVHNGIIENYHTLKKQLMSAGHSLTSETDTELLAHVVEDALQKTTDLKQLVQTTIAQVEGAYAFLALLQQFPDTMVAVRKGSPLCIGFGEGNKYCASDVLAFAGKAQKVLYMPDESFALITKDAVQLYDFFGKALPVKVQDIDIEWHDDGKQGYEHFMLKEIYEQKNAIHATISFFRSMDDSVWDQCGLSVEDVRNLKSLSFIGSGTSWHAARIGQFFFEMIAKIPTRVMLSSEFRYMPFFPDMNSLYITISQSGETADTLEALRLVDSLGRKPLVLTNIASSTMVREAHGFLLTHAGPEVAVASTKAFATQLASLYWLAHRIAFERNVIDKHQLEQAYADVFMCAEVLENSIEKHVHDIERSHAPFYEKFNRFIFLGRHISYPFAMEAALKLKEVSYIFSQCYPAGELKHGPIALIDSETPVILFSALDPVVYPKLVSNAQEVKARNGHLLVFAFEGQTELLDLADCSFVFPRVNPLLAPLAMTGVMQFLVYHIAQLRGCPIDKPRNLAKSVTVE